MTAGVVISAPTHHIGKVGHRSHHGAPQQEKEKSTANGEVPEPAPTDVPRTFQRQGYCAFSGLIDSIVVGRSRRDPKRGGSLELGLLHIRGIGRGRGRVLKVRIHCRRKKRKRSAYDTFRPVELRGLISPGANATAIHKVVAGQSSDAVPMRGHAGPAPRRPRNMASAAGRAGRRIMHSRGTSEHLNHQRRSALSEWPFRS